MALKHNECILACNTSMVLPTLASLALSTRSLITITMLLHILDMAGVVVLCMWTLCLSSVMAYLWSFCTRFLIA